MMRHRASSQPENSDAESSDDDDAFTALSRKRKGEAKSKDAAVSKKSTTKDQTESEYSSTNNKAQIESGIKSQKPVVVAQTSSTKRHHGEVSDARKAKLDAILLELEADTSNVATSTPSHLHNRRSNSSGTTHQRNIADTEQHHRTGGSFVDPGDELITTNIFVGNLAPSITEEQMTELFRQFGDLYSVKVMWPRTPEERLRNRHTGFVCFMNRQDAEDAMDACNEQDPFRVGRQLMMRWGKNVRKRDGGVPIVHRGVGGITAMPPPNALDIENQVAAAVIRSELNQKSEIHVVVPKDRNREKLISTVASFVAKDGNQFEQMLLQYEGQNTHLTFLSMPAIHATNSSVAKEEFIYYKWRVYAFCQGDGFSTWRTEPFTMVQPNGCIWYPPPLDIDAAQREVDEKKRKEETIRSLKGERRYQNSKRNILTGRQLEQQRKKGLDGVELSEGEIIEYDKLFKQDLCMSRESICQAMAFCFEKSNAAKQISSMIQDLLLQLLPGISIETLSARLYLISDILYNSQQPGIRNAFLYRDAIERMSPDFFSVLGDFLRTNFGRLSQERVAATVSQVFSAWSHWGVFDPTFINDLLSRFEGRTVIHSEDDTDVIQENIIPSEVLVDNNTPEGTN